MKQPTAYLSNLTPLRGIAALLTVIFHVDLMIGGGGGMLLKLKDSMFINRLYLMVDFFFILSGFIMLHVYGQWFKADVTSPTFKRFTIARFARVYPLHFATLVYCILLKLIFLGMGGVSHSPMDAVCNNFWTIPSHLLLIHSMNVNEWFTWNNASWSISTEWWMYMVFPFLVKPFSKLRSVGHLAVAIACFIGYLAITYWIVPIVSEPASIPFVRIRPESLSINVSYQYGFLRCFFGFVLGMVVYQVYTEGVARRFFGNGYALLAAALGLSLCLHFAVADVFSVVFFPFILISAAYGSQNMNVFFSLNALQRLGDWSFSIYLVHQPLLYTIQTIIEIQKIGKPFVPPTGPPDKIPMLTGWLICLAFTAVTLLVSYLTYRFVEVPARRWINPK